ncbi:MAG: hypothetical protein LRS46_01945 [Desulfurococcales archaeon]|nr:hypothetical protein [Desulfurococcales archaeon]
MSRGLQRALSSLVRSEPLLSALLVITAVLAIVSRGFRCRILELSRPNALGLLAGLMASSGLLEESGLLARLGWEAAERGPPWGALALAEILLGTLSAFTMNDAAILVAAPLASMIARASDSDAAVAVALMAVAVNMGSSLTPFGNPQNILIWHDYGVPLWGFTAAMTPLVLAGFAVLAAFTYALLRGRAWRLERGPPPRVDRTGALVGVTALALTVCLASLGVPGAIAGLAGLASSAAYDWRVIYSVNPAVLLLIGSLFADFTFLGGLLRGHLPAGLLRGGAPLYLLAASLSQVVSNVPAAAMLAGLAGDWRALAYGVDVGGVLLVTGSIANVLAVKMGRIPLRRYQKAQLMVALPILLAGLAIIAR